VFDTEPVSVSSVLYDAGSELLPVARSYDVRIDLDIGGRFGPVMANRQALQAALVSLGYALIEALPSTDKPQLRLQLSAHRCRYGIVAGVYCDAEDLTAQTLRQGRMLYGRTRQPMTQLTPSSGAGIFVADAILHAMKTQLTTSRHHNLRGLATVLQPNPQLQLI
jgi:ribosomal protein S9